MPNKHKKMQKPTIETLVEQQRSPESNLERFARLNGTDPRCCPVCHAGHMVRIRELPRIRSPGGGLTPTAAGQLSLNPNQINSFLRQGTGKKQPKKFVKHIIPGRLMYFIRDYWDNRCTDSYRHVRRS